MVAPPGKIHGSRHCCQELNLISKFISDLWNAPENQDLVKKFMENELCRICALNEDPAKAKEYFTTYMVVRFPKITTASHGVLRFFFSKTICILKTM